MTKQRFKTLNEFYPFYLSEHRNFGNRVLHFIGTGLIVLAILAAILFHELRFILIAPFIGYAFAWAGHYFFEKNKPAALRYPAFNIAGNFIFFWEILTGNRTFNANKDHT